MPNVIEETISQTFLKRVESSPDHVGFVFKPTYAEDGPVGKWKKLTFQEFHDRVQNAAFGLKRLGVKKGDKVVILSNTRMEWSLCDMAILGTGAVTVPIYPSVTPSDISYILKHCEAKVAIIEDTQQVEKLNEILSNKELNPEKLEQVVVIEPSANSKLIFPDSQSLISLQELGKHEHATDPDYFHKNLRDTVPSDLLTICYTSGTTGTPKGVMLSHDNMMSVLDDSFEMLGKFTEPESEVCLSFLPFSHILGKVESMGGYICGWTQWFAESFDQVSVNLNEAKPTVIFAVPRVFEKAYSKIQDTLSSSSPRRKMIFNWAVTAGKEHNEKSTLLNSLSYGVAKSVVFKKITSKFGGRLKLSICGGAPLPKDICEFFKSIGLPILEGYGLTETCAPVCTNDPINIRPGTVGKPLRDVLIKTASDGEILVKSRKVFLGYYKQPELTNLALKDGWLHTGDIGYLDEDGYLYITDRKKDLIVTSSGKNIAPQKIENLAKTADFISEFVVYGDRRNYLTALVTLDQEQVIRYAASKDILFSEFSELIKNPTILAKVQTVVDAVNAKLASFETIKKFIVLRHEFTVETGELTPSMKIKRRFVGDKFQSELASMYL